MKIAMIGAGLAGVASARALVASGHRVRLFDKGRGAGGRMAARRIDTTLGTATFDHGAQYLTARDPDFAGAVADWASLGIVAPYPAAGAEAWVGMPAMNAPLKHLARDLDVRFGARIETIERADGWRLIGADLSEDRFDAVVVAIPAEQAAPLLEQHVREFAEQARATRSEPCWTVLAAFAERVALPDVVRDAGGIGWAARNSTKPGRSGPEAWVIQGSPTWSERHLEDDAAEVVSALTAELAAQTGALLPMPLQSHAHRWRYARSGTLGRDYLWDAERAIGVCGDWMLGPRVENAWLSGTRLAAAIGAAA